MEPFAEKPTLTGRAVTLRPVVAADAPAMYEATLDPEGRRLTGTHHEFTPDEVERWAATRAEQVDRLDLSIVDTVTGEWSGELAVMDWDPDNLSCAYRIAVRSGRRGRGIGTEATRLVVDHVFRTTPARRIGLDVYAFNERAIAVYEKVGFRREGVLRDGLRWGGEWHDVVLMGMTRPDWEAAPGNRIGTADV